VKYEWQLGKLESANTPIPPFFFKKNKFERYHRRPRNIFRDDQKTLIKEKKLTTIFSDARNISRNRKREAENKIRL
jgi:hypothetical protein